MHSCLLPVINALQLDGGTKVIEIIKIIMIYGIQRLTPVVVIIANIIDVYRATQKCDSEATTWL